MVLQKMRLRLERKVEAIQETGGLRAGALIVHKIAEEVFK